jgi:hypothetical protein
MRSRFRTAVATTVFDFVHGGCQDALCGEGNQMGFDIGGRLTREELAWELVEVFEELPAERINELLAKNVPFETLRFLSVYADDFGAANAIEGVARKRLPNLLVLGYLLRVLEDRLIDDDDPAGG